MSDSLQPHKLQHARPPCPSPTPRVHSDSCPLSQWCHPAISSSVVPFSSCPQSLPESFPMSQLFAWGGQRTGVSALASLFPKNTQDWSPSEWTRWISLQSKGLSRDGLNCSLACGIFPDEVSNQCLLHWQVDSLPLSHQGSPFCFIFIKESSIFIEWYFERSQKISYICKRKFSSEICHYFKSKKYF